MDEKEVRDQLSELAPEERAEAWENYVRMEVHSLLDVFLPESISGNVGIKYEHPVKKVDARTGKPEIDYDLVNGVSVVLKFDFAAPVQFYEGDPRDQEPSE